MDARTIVVGCVIGLLAGAVAFLGWALQELRGEVAGSREDTAALQKHIDATAKLWSRAVYQGLVEHIGPSPARPLSLSPPPNQSTSPTVALHPTEPPPAGIVPPESIPSSPVPGLPLPAALPRTSAAARRHFTQPIAPEDVPPSAALPFEPVPISTDRAIVPPARVVPPAWVQKA